MSKFCTSCGKQLSDEASFCAYCGASQPSVSPPVQQASSPAPTYTPAAPAYPAYDVPAQTSSKLTKNGIIGIVAISLIAVVIVITAIFVISGLCTSYKTPVNNMCQGLEKSDWNKFIGSYYGKTTYSYSVYLKSSSYKDGNEFMKNTMNKSLEAEYGSNIKISVKFNKATKLSTNDTVAMASSYYSKYKDAVKIDEAYEVNCTINIKGKTSSESDDETFKVGKVGGKWYIFEGGIV